MNVKRFEAPDMAAALEMIRRELGPEAVVISSRRQTSSRILGLRRRNVIEVIAGLPDGASAGAASEAEAEGGPAPATGEPTAAPRPASVRTRRSATADGAAALEISAAAHEAAVEESRGDRVAAPAVAQEPPIASEQSESGGGFTALDSLVERISGAEPSATSADEGEAPPAAVTAGSLGTEQFEALSTQIGELRRLIVAAPRQPGGTEAVLPEAAREFVERLREGGVSEALITRTREAAAELLDAGAGADAAQAAMRKSLLSLIPAAGTPKYEHGKTIAIHLVGPSGTGKTVAAVKLALQLARSEGRAVILANADQKRPGAGAQLAAYGESLDLPTAQIYEPSDLKELAAQHPEAAIVVDTPGGLPRSAAELTWYRGLTNAIRRRRIFLALEATAKESDLTLGYEAFRPLKLTGVILSKLDETERYGAALSFLHSAEARLLFVSDDADVLSELEAAGAAALLDRVLQATTGDGYGESVAS